MNTSRKFESEIISDKKLAVWSKLTPSPIREGDPYIYAKVGEVHLVIFLPKKSGPFTNRNLLAFDGDGKVLWTIESVPPVDDRSNPYISVSYIEKHDRVIVQTWNESWHYLDLATGKVEPCVRDQNGKYSFD